jgi:Protein of unknown function (DUF664)
LFRDSAQIIDDAGMSNPRADPARRSVEPSTLSLLGLVRHMAEVERVWFRRRMASHDAPPHFRSETSQTVTFDGGVSDPEVVAQAWDLWRAEAAFADRFGRGS